MSMVKALRRPHETSGEEAKAGGTKGCPTCYIKERKKLGKIHLRFLGHLHISELVKFGMGSGWDRLQVGTGDT